VIFNTWVYGLFLALAWMTYWFIPARLRPALLALLGCCFYGYASLPHLAGLLLLTALVWAVAFRVAPGSGATRGVWFVASLVLALGVLGYFKYEGFLLRSLAFLTGRPGLGTPAHPSVAAPLAISFFTFEFVHYLIEIHRGTFAAAGPLEFALFIFFFPTLVCGPIKRFGAFRPQEHARQRADPVDMSAALGRIVVGLAKKTLIADQVAAHATAVFANPAAFDRAGLWLGVYAYAAQIYFDFSGYSDIAIGSARLFGYSVPENFNWPYLQPNIAQFWRSWHMSLTSWITDYVYIPLGGNRRGAARAVGNRLIAMSLCGLWHGAGFHFIVWGAFHGVALNVFRLFDRGYVRLLGERPQASWPGRVLGTLLTFHVVCIGWVLFVCDVDRAWPIILRLLPIPR
jgi:alginate O-acetyltransferase complex protein AlgI